jgi:hypothetical protein
MTDHHDFGWEDHHEPVPFDDHGLETGHSFETGHDFETHHDFGDEPHAYEDHAPLPGHDGAGSGTHLPDHDEPVADPHGTGADAYDQNHTEPDISDMPDHNEVFPPPVDVGDLPEPVDGFPWIDTGSLGVVHAVAAADPAEPVPPHELAEYAATELPPAADPWAALADSDDPATSALAKWWSEN